MEHNNTTIKDTILEKITTEKVTPTSKWYFVVRHAIWWIPGIVVTVVGSFAIAGMIFGFVHAGWEYRSFTRLSLIGFMLRLIPFVWVVSFSLFGVLIVHSLRLTAKGYRYKTGVILGVSMAISILIGFGIFFADMHMMKNPVIRFNAEHNQKILWNMAEEGRLAGVIDIDEEDGVLLVDSKGKRWILDTSEFSNQMILKEGNSVRVVGLRLGEDEFLVCSVFPWEMSPFKQKLTDSKKYMHPRNKRGPRLSPVCQEFLEKNRPSPFERK